MKLHTVLAVLAPVVFRLGVRFRLGAIDIVVCVVVDFVGNTDFKLSRYPSV